MPETPSENTQLNIINVTMDELRAHDLADHVRATFEASKPILLTLDKATVGGKIVEFLHDPAHRTLDIYLNHHLLHVNY